MKILMWQVEQMRPKKIQFTQFENSKLRENEPLLTKLAR